MVWATASYGLFESRQTRLGGHCVAPACDKWMDMATGEGTVNLETDSWTDKFHQLLLFVEDMLYTADPRPNELDKYNGLKPGFPAPMDRVRRTTCGYAGRHW